MLGSSVPASFSVKQSPHLCVSQASPINAHLKFFEVEAKNIRKTRPTTAVFQSLSSASYFRPSLNKPKSSLVRTVTARVTDEYDGSGGSADPTSQVHSSLDSKEATISSSYHKSSHSYTNEQHSSSHSHIQPRTDDTFSLRPSITIYHKSPSSSSSKPRRPSVIEIEHALGTGRFRDTNPRELENEKDLKFDMETMSYPEKFEVPIQKRLRKTSNWLVQQTENSFRMSGKKIFMVTFFWILPIWALAVLVATGTIDIPFINQFIDR